MLTPISPDTNPHHVILTPISPDTNPYHVILTSISTDTNSVSRDIDPILSMLANLMLIHE